VLVKRGFALLGVELRAGHCRHCGERIAGRWLP
jgi:hypothetical protein